MSTTSPSHCLLVLGMHRSGTSATTRVLNLLGAALPRELQPAGKDNPLGFWEGERFIRLHDEFLAAAGLTWQAPWNLPAGYFDGPDADARVARLARLIGEEIGPEPLFAIKDPRVCRLVPLWRRALAELGSTVSAVLVVRHPMEVALSLHTREAIPLESGLLLWLRYVLEAEAASRDMPRSVVRYEELLADWRAVARPLAAAHGFAWPSWTGESEAAIDKFLNREMRHHEAAPLGGPGASAFEADWLAPIYDALSRGEAPAELFDRVRCDLERTDALYGLGARRSAQWVPPKLETLVREVREARHALEHSLAPELADKLGSVTRSTSWRVTQPLRYLGYLIGDSRGLRPRDLPDALKSLLAGRLPVPVAQARAKRIIADSRLWKRQFYIDRYPDADRTDPLRHFVEVGAARGYAPNPWFDVPFYTRENQPYLAGSKNPVVDYIERGAWEGSAPHPDFDNDAYLRAHPTLKLLGLTPLAHFLAHGAEIEIVENAAPVASAPAPSPRETRSTGLLQRLIDARALIPKTGSTIAPDTATLGAPGRAKLLFASHELSRTGAPLILLELVRRLARRVDADLIVFADASGPLLSEFAAVAHVVLGDVLRPFAPGGLADLPTLLDKLAAPVPGLALCNTANMLEYQRVFRDRGIPVLTLVHEAATPYGEDYYRAVIETAAAVVVPSRHVKDVALREVGAAAERMEIIPQGLLRESILAGDRAAAALSIRAELGLPPASRIVLGCGTMDLRKGIDLFTTIALAAARRSCGDVHFVWVGHFDPQRKSPTYWAAQDVATAGLGSRVHFVGARDDANPWFLGSDLFLLTSREDPFPCVVHEAMAARLPVIAFAGGGGAPDAIGETGTIVPYTDIEAATEAVLALLADPARREALGAAAAARVRTHFMFDAYVERLLALTETLGAKLPPSDAA